MNASVITVMDRFIFAIDKCTIFRKVGTAIVSSYEWSKSI